MGRSTDNGAQFDFYGLRVAVGGDWPEVLEAVGRDFAWFRGSGEASPLDVQITVERRAPDFDAFGPLSAAFVTPRNVVYQQDGRTIVDYFGRALSVLDRPAGRLVVQGEDRHLVHEAVYLFLLSRVGEHLDARGLTRLHALGITGAHGALAIMIPSGGGKSTLAVRALRDEGVRLLSDDSPLLDRNGCLHPFPLRIGINATDEPDFPSEHVHRIERMEFHPKLAVDLSVYADRIERTPQPLRDLVIATRSLGRESSLTPLPRRAAVGTLIREVVVGVGLYQGMEFILQRGMRDAAGMLGTAARRSQACATGLRRARVWRLVLGRDDDRNWEALQPLIR